MSDLIQLTPSKSNPTPKDDFWALAESACYLKGRGVTFGPPLLKPGAVGAAVYSIPVALAKVDGVAAVDQNFNIFADGSLDHVLITPQLAACNDPQSLLREAGRKLKLGGHLIVLTEVNIPRTGHRTLDPASVRQWCAEAGRWQCKQDIEQRQKSLIILKRVKGTSGIVPQPAPSGRKRVCIARYGALGDAIVLTPLIRALAEQGCEITMNVSSYCLPVFEGNPHIHNVLIQERDLIPNYLLGRYWAHWESRYDQYINLSESIEGDLLMVENRPQFFSRKDWRHSRCNRNYVEYTLERAGVQANNYKCELYFTGAERRRAEKYWAQFRGKFTVLWGLNGSSHHKVYPLLEPLLNEWLAQHPDAHVILSGDKNAQLLQFSHPQVTGAAGQWNLREALIAPEYVSCVVGPETMLTNAAGCTATPTITLLSHSTHENLCKHWDGDLCLTPDPAEAPCYPCHQLHYTKESCPIATIYSKDTGEAIGDAPVCSLAIAPYRVMERLDQVYATWKSSKLV